jgi:hypothetical protein
MDSMLAIGPKVRVFKPGRGTEFLRVIKICCHAFFRGEVKPSTPCKFLWHVNPLLANVPIWEQQFKYIFKNNRVSGNAKRLSVAIKEGLNLFLILFITPLSG